MLRVFFLIASFFLLDNSNGQVTSHQISPIEINGVEGVIFPLDYDVSFHLGAEYLNNRFTPTIQQLLTFEKGFIEQINTLDNSFKVSNPKKFFKSHKRQYLGYINNKEDSVILTQFVDLGDFFSFKRRSHFSGWKEYFLTCLSDFCYRHLRLYQFNLKTQKLEIT